MGIKWTNHSYVYVIFILHAMLPHIQNFKEVFIEVMLPALTGLAFFAGP